MFAGSTEYGEEYFQLSLCVYTKEPPLLTVVNSRRMLLRVMRLQAIFMCSFFGVIAAKMQEKCLGKMANDVIFSKKDAAAFNTNEILLKGGVVDKDEK